MTRVDISSSELDELLWFINDHYGYDFGHYAKASLKRRITGFMEDERLPSMWQLKEFIQDNEGNFALLLQHITVNVTDMFRDPLYYKCLREQVLPHLASYPLIRIWHAGCSTGEEVYSMAILLHEAGLLDRSRIYATDINAKVVDMARKGIKK